MIASSITFFGKLRVVASFFKFDLGVRSDLWTVDKSRLSATAEWSNMPGMVLQELPQVAGSSQEGLVGE